MNDIKHLEVQLLGWSKSTSKKGPKIELLLQSDEDIEFFEMLTIAKGKTAGQLLDMAFSLSEQDGQDVPRETKPKGGKLSIDAALLCKEPKFWDYVVTHGDEYDKSEESAKNYIYAYCRIESRAELDHSETAAQIFKHLHHNFSQWTWGQ